MAIPQTARKLLLLPDVHVPYQDETALSIVEQFARDWKPHDVVAVGDWMSADQASDYANDCDVDLADEFATVRHLLERFNVTHYLMGNHEERLTRASTKRTRRKHDDPASNLQLDKRGIKWRPYDNRKGIFKFGKLNVIHGFRTNEYVAKMTAQEYDCVAFGHTHRMQLHQPKHAKRAHTGFNIGCLCKLDLEYARTWPPPGWRQGFMFAYVFKSGHFSPGLVSLVGSEFVIEGRYYGRGRHG